MQALGWIFLAIFWIGITSALSFCLGKVLGSRVEENRSRKARGQSD